MSSPLSPAVRAASSPPGAARGLGGRAAANQLAMRVSDAERAEVADELSRHYSEGRLDEGEFTQRLDRTMAATTYRDLSGVLYDLPPLRPESRPDRRPARASRPGHDVRPARGARGARGAGLRLALLAFLVILVAAISHVVVWALAPVAWVCLIAAVAVLILRRR
jgi:Domain of unknown function (DUF1707)